MKCPSCSAKIGVFSKALNTFGKIKKCPVCHNRFQLRIRWKWLLILLIPSFILKLLVGGFFEALGVPIIFGNIAVMLILIMLVVEPEKIDDDTTLNDAAVNDD